LCGLFAQSKTGNAARDAGLANGYFHIGSKEKFLQDFKTALKRRGMSMNKIREKNAVAVLLFICIVFLVIDSAFAHRVNVYAWVDGDTIYVESKFAGGRPVKSGKIAVIDPQGVELLSGLTNPEGEFSFKIPKRTDLKIVLNAGQGHRGEWTIHAVEMTDSPSGTASEAGAEKAGPSEQNNAVSKTTVNTGSVIPDTDRKTKDLEAAIESVLDRKLKPITRMLADMQQEGPSVKDIFAGIGYIFGLVGIVAYVQSRKKKG
jgi:nickel transport protein